MVRSLLNSYKVTGNVACVVEIVAPSRLPRTLASNLGGGGGGDGGTLPLLTCTLMLQPLLLLLLLHVFPCWPRSYHPSLHCRVCRPSPGLVRRRVSEKVTDSSPSLSPGGLASACSGGSGTRS